MLNAFPVRSTDEQRGYDSAVQWPTPQCSHGCSLRPKPTFCGRPFSDERGSGRRSVQGWKGEGTNGCQYGRDFCRGEGIAPDEGRPLAGFERGELDGANGGVNITKIERFENHHVF